MCTNRLIPAFCLVAFGAGSLLAQREIKATPLTGTGQGIVWRATLTRFQKSDEGSPPMWSTPAFRVNLKISNYTNQPVQLGGLLAVIEAVEGRDEYASVYIALASRKDDPRLKMVEERYGFDWGVYVVENWGLWPIVRVASSMSATDRFFLAGASPREYNFSGGGFGSLPPRSHREIVEEVLFPVGVQMKVGQVAVVAPSYQRAAEPNVRQEVFIFDASGFDLSKPPQSDQEFKEPKVASITRTVASLTTTASSESEPAWRRILALNWLADTNLPAAEPVFLRFATGTGNEKVQLAAVTNLGAWKVKTAVGPLTTLLGTAGDAVKTKAVWALGEIGDVAAAPAVRPLLNDQKMKPSAIETLGKLKDAESVAFLLAEVRKDTTAGIPASVGLGLIANESAVAGLTAIVSDKKAGRVARAQAWGALRSIGSARTLDLASTTLADKQEEYFHSFAVDTLAVLIKSGSVDARAVLTKYAEQPGSPERSRARKALGLPE